MLPSHTQALTDAALATSGLAEPTTLARIFKAHPDLRMRYDSLTTQQRDNVRALAAAGLAQMVQDTLSQVTTTATPQQTDGPTYPDNWLLAYDASDQTPTVTEWKGNELLQVSTTIGAHGFQFGKAKAETVLAHLDAIERYVVTNGQDNPLPGERSDAVLMLPLSKGRTWILKPAQAVAIYQHRQAVAHFVYLRTADDKLMPERTPSQPSVVRTDWPLMLAAGETQPTDPETGTLTLFDVGPAALTLTSPAIPATATYTQTDKPLALFATGAYIAKAPDRAKQATQTDTVEDLPLFGDKTVAPDGHPDRDHRALFVEAAIAYLKAGHALTLPATYYKGRHTLKAYDTIRLTPQGQVVVRLGTRWYLITTEEINALAGQMGYVVDPVVCHECEQVVPRSRCRTLPEDRYQCFDCLD